MSDLTDFIEARLQEDEDTVAEAKKNKNILARILSRIVAARGLVNLHSVAGHDCPGRDYDGHRIPDYEVDCPTLMLLAHPYRRHPDWRGEWKA